MPGRYGFSGMARRGGASNGPAEIEASKREWTKMVAILDGQLAGTGGYVAGNSFTLADIPIGLSVNRWFLTPIDRPRFANVEAYYERLRGRPAFQRFGRNGVA